MSFIREIIDSLLKEIKSILKEHLRETTNALKKRLQKLLITGIIAGILFVVLIALIGSGVLFLIIGQLTYLSTFMPAWMAWDIMGLTSIGIGALILLVLYLIIRKQLRTKPKQEDTKA